MYSHGHPWTSMDNHGHLCTTMYNNWQLWTTTYVQLCTTMDNHVPGLLFLTCRPDNNGSTIFFGWIKVLLLNCHNTLERDPNTLGPDHLTEQNPNEIRLADVIMDWTFCFAHEILCTVFEPTGPNLNPYWLRWWEDIVRVDNCWWQGICNMGWLANLWWRDTVYIYIGWVANRAP